MDRSKVCVGPLEWDLAFLPQEAVGVFPEIDIELLGLLRDAEQCTPCDMVLGSL